jgi:peptide-methionine (R)-S-oxide reductase
MFDSNRDTRNEGSTDVRRRVFLATAAATVAGLALWRWRKPIVMQAARAASGEPKDVTIVLFSDSGQRLKIERIPKVVKTEGEWRKQLSGNVFDITRHADTEIA